MTFYVSKTLATGPIRFGVSPRNGAPRDAEDPSVLSTGPRGEFLRKRTTGFFFNDVLPAGRPALPVTRSAASMPFLQSLKPDGTPRGYGFLALMFAGAFFVLLGLAVVIAKGPQGWVEVILGAAMIATPIVLTAQHRKRLREAEARQRAEREAEEKRNREMLASFTAALERLRHDQSPEALEHVRREREALTLPYELFAPLARRTVLDIGFAGLHDPATSKAMQESARAAGLSDDEIAALEAQLREIVAWHFIADDRLDATDAAAAGELRRLRDLPQLPRIDCSVPMRRQEYCIHSAPATLLEPKREEPCTVIVTSRRLILQATKPREIPLPKVYEINVDADVNLLTIKTDEPRKPLKLHLEQAIYLAGIIDLATGLQQKPRGFA